MSDYYRSEWLHDLSAIKSKATLLADQQAKKPTTKRVAYVLYVDDGDVKIEVFHATSRKNGISVSPKKVDLRNLITKLPAYLTYQDYAAISLLHQMNTNPQESNKNSAKLLRVLLDTGRFVLAPSNTVLQLGADQQLDLTWSIDEDGNQSFRATDQNYLVFPLYQPLYINLVDSTIGQVITTDPALINHLLKAPKIRPRDVTIIGKAIAKLDQNDQKILLPQEFKVTKNITILPRPKLRLFGYNLYVMSARAYKTLVLLDLSFDYDGHITTGELFGRDKYFTRYRQGALEQISYVPAAEKKFFDEIQEIVPLRSIDDLKANRILTPYHPDDLDHCYTSINNLLKPDLEKINLKWQNLIKIAKDRKWSITIDQSCPLQDIQQVEEWFTDVAATSENNWFDLDMGVQVDGRKISLLPILHDMLKDPAIFDNLEIPKKYQIDLDGYTIELPGERVHTMLKFLQDVYSRISNNQLQISNLEMVRLAEFEAATTALGMRWLNQTKLTDIGRKLMSFTGIKAVQIPQSFTAVLRPYQQEGVNWLQFLQEYGLAGILADDMGLGKTIQGLAHIAIEQAKGLKKPFLVIAPTTVMANWFLEAKRFVPELKIIELKAGTDRQQQIKQLADFDLVLTSYPLVLRDQEELLKQEFHCIILDEAQYIKNNKAKITAIVNQLNSNHRLCLTGTPLENHLGELWSLFNFLMPGFLGDATSFTKNYRTPIEKRQDQECRASLVSRISPFMLRRTKDKVAKELPQKTEIIKFSQLEGKQADLYEVIRVSMHEKITAEIADKGLARSHIMLLDALLKLRQICCHPQLLKMDSAKEIKTSAKMEQLLEMIPAMIEEGRKIVIFSQFVSMIALIEAELKLLKLPYAKIVGDTKHRLKEIEDFQQGKVNLFVISIKAGGTGINLTAADTVIHFDPWWNPAVEQQATDRVHRIGQDKPVFVYKMIISSSVEEKILAMQARKAKLAEAIFDVEKSSTAQITIEDINNLFAPLRSEALS